MINPGEIPQYTGDFDKLSTAVTALRTHAIGIRNKGQDVHSRFQATAAYYKAPEADQLFSSTQPVMDTADDFAADIESLADALDTFISEAKPYAKRLERLKEKAIAFVGSVEGDDDWTDDQDKVDAQKALMDGVAVAVAGFQEAERTAATKINAISPALCRPGWVVDDGSHAPGMYGLSASTMKDAKELPWGSAEGRTYERWSLDWWGHGIKSWAWDGFVKDGLWGSFIGLGILEDNLLGVNGSVAQHETWDRLKRTAVGTYAYGMDAVGLGDHLSDWQRGSEAYTKEFGKQFVAYDMWNEDPARAHGLTTFNLITVVGGTAGALTWLGRGSRVAEAAGTVARAADFLDPISGTARAARALSDLPKISETLARVSEHLKLPKTKFPDGALDDLSNRYRVDKDGNFIALKPDGTPDTSLARHELAAGDRVSIAQPRDRELAGVGGRATEATDRSGASRHMPPHSSHGATEASLHSSRPHEAAEAGARAEHATGAAYSSSQPPGQTVREAGGHAASGEGHSGRPAGRGAVERSGGAGGAGRSGSTGVGHGHDAHGSGPGHDSADHDAAGTHEAHDPPTKDDSSAETHEHHSEGEGNVTRRELPPGTAERTLRQMRAMRHSRARYKGAEDYLREMVGGAPERHYRVPTHDHPYYPVRAPMGRYVDVPVDMPGGRTLAIEVKHYLEWRTVTLKDGSTRNVRGEVPLDKRIIEEINKDLTLRRQDPKFDPRWVFLHAPPSEALRKYLIQARIIFVEYGPAPKQR
ncbi:hypothetical protein NGF19_03765 [Streptomyces sp. RY43-2]|uniref:WXG100 family type VII secretion target n=1 Tax=Streptomyces macrolidinus TaxID=2952607 RepID=A0ABT0ZAR5_9ACTN|nr:hypothetical protein [Streptomyces macrolidinus]MCN9239911.1 hypothetical protein [Streptomyces macrolidinus]